MALPKTHYVKLTIPLFVAALSVVVLMAALSIDGAINILLLFLLLAIYGYLILMALESKNTI